MYTSYKVSKKLKEFLGDSAPEPVHDTGDRITYYPNKCRHIEVIKPIYCKGVYAYQLHDLLAKSFCEAMARKTRTWGGPGKIGIPGVYDFLTLAYYKGGMPAVEKALLNLMEAK